jgi:hypothetical protein
MLAGVAEALRAVHAVGIVHRDLKPSNILLGQDGPFVIDFGIAQASDSTALTRTGLKVGTPSFMAPEQIRGSLATPAADVWALGAVALYAATGQRAFGEGDTTVVYYRVVHEAPDLSACPAWLLPLVQACLSKDPEARPDLQEVLDFLKGISADHRTATTKIVPGPGVPDAPLDDDATTLRDDDATVLKVPVQPSSEEPAPEPEAPAARRRLSRPLTWIVAAAGLLVVGGVTTAVMLGMPSGSTGADPTASGSASASASTEASPAAIDECLVGSWRLDSLTQQADLGNQSVEATGFEGRVTEFQADGTQLVNYDDAEPLRAELSAGEYTETWTGTARYPVRTSENTLTATGVDFSDVSVVKALGDESAEYQPSGGTPAVEYACDDTTYTEQGAKGYEATYTRID